MVFTFNLFNIMDIIKFKIEGKNYYFSNNKKLLLFFPKHLVYCVNNDDNSEIINKKSYYYRKYRFLKANGFFKKVRHINKKITKYDIKKSFINTSTIILGMTEYCNLNCAYCVYGKYYYHKPITEDSFDINTIKHFMNFMFNYKLRNNIQSEIIVDFYGGEPLLRIKYIKNIINHLKKINLPFRFSMTTNGVLLNKNIDFLVENNFFLTVSLDGDANQNKFRVFKNNSESYNIVYRNLLKIMNLYPNYFETNVNITAVKHRLNNDETASEFVLEKFNKILLSGDINTYHVKEELKEEHKIIFQIKDGEYNSNINNLLKRYFKINYSYFLSNKVNKFPFSNGTCLPFSASLYISNNGDILSCEKISNDFSLGNIYTNKKFIDFEYMANQINKYNINVQNKCNLCYNFECGTCIFNIRIDASDIECKNFISKHNFGEILKNLLNSEKIWK